MNSCYPVILKYENGKIIVDGKKACRACLSTQCKLFDLFCNNLAEELSELTGTVVSRGDGLPQYLCSVCCALLRKGTALQKKCRTVSSMFQNILSSNVFAGAAPGTLYKCNIRNSSLKISLVTSAVLKVDIPGVTLDNCNDVTEVKRRSRHMVQVKRLNDPNNEEKEIEIKIENDIEELDPLVVQQCDQNNDIKVELDKDASTNPTDISLQRTNDLGDDLDNDHQQFVDTDDTNDNLDASIDQFLTDIKNKRKPKQPRVVYSSPNVNSEVFMDSLSKKILKRPRAAKINNTNKNIKKTRISDVLESVETESDVSTDLDEDGSEGNVSMGDCSDDEFNEESLLKLISEIETETSILKKERFKKKQMVTFTKNKFMEKKYNVKMQMFTKEEQIRNFKARQESKKYKTSKYKCEYCYKGFMVEDIYKRHMTSHDPSSGDYVCEICTMRYSKSKNYRNHLLIHSQSFTCKECGYATAAKNKAIYHYECHAGKMYGCKLCSKVFRNVSTYSSHLQMQHSTIKCYICKNLYRSQALFKKHIQNQHSEAITQMLCAECNVHFTSDTALIKHLQEKPTGGCKNIRACEYCGQNTDTEEQWRAHLLQLHNVKLQCDECNVTYINELRYNRHRREKHNDGPLILTAAPVDFAPTSSGLPSGPRQYMCEYCSEILTGSSSYWRHVSRHKQQGLKCSICSREFSNHVLLKNHSRVHSGEKPFKCPRCGKTFSLEWNCNRHVQQVHERNFKYTCHDCGKRYLSKVSLVGHVRTSHMNMPWPKRKRTKRTRKEAP